MKVKWSPTVENGIMGYIDSDWNINLCYCILGRDHSILIEAETLVHELMHWLIRISAFDRVWDRLTYKLIESLKRGHNGNSFNRLIN